MADNTDSGEAQWPEDVALRWPADEIDFVDCGSRWTHEPHFWALGWCPGVTAEAAAEWRRRMAGWL